MLATGPLTLFCVPTCWLASCHEIAPGQKDGGAVGIGVGIGVGVGLGLGGGVGMVRFCPTWMTSGFTRRFTRTRSSTVTPYRVAIKERVSPGRTTCRNWLDDE